MKNQSKKFYGMDSSPLVFFEIGNPLSLASSRFELNPDGEQDSDHEVEKFQLSETAYMSWVVTALMAVYLIQS